jgi:1,4-dihydroxy-6-naphthoate synthase
VTTTIQLAISPCPNDTFAFHAILHRRIDLRGLQFDVRFLDIEELNSRFAAGDFDACKVSFVAALDWSPFAVVLPAGAALGFGVGPLLLADQPVTLEALAALAAGSGPLEVACPGEHTTATFLCTTLLPFPVRPRQMRFSEIMPALQSGEVTLGVCIHEGRFTWRRAGLHCVADLGSLWEARTAAPLPLGGIVARKRLGADTLRTIAAVIRDSVQFGLDHRAETLPTMRAHAQEFSDEVLLQHVDLYVNQWTLELGDVGRSALRTMQALAAQRPPAVGPPLEVLETGIR